MIQIQLKRLREEKGISQQELATAIGVAQSAVGNWESGLREPRSLKQLEQIADFFGVSTDYLLGREGAQEKPTSVSGDGLSEEQLEVIRHYEAAPPALRAAALAVLRAAEEQGKTQDGGAARK